MPHYFHLSKSILGGGTILTNPGHELTDSVVEEILSRNKPKHLIERRKAIFVSETQNFSAHGLSYLKGYIHKVEVKRPVLRVDNRWIGELQARRSASGKIRTLMEASSLTDDQVATHYWEGVESSEPNWEILVPEAEVMECVSTEPVTVAYTKTESLESKIRSVIGDRN